ncbi:MAG: sulfatase [Actinomycetota bacterium]|nr:sulfatase [Actinomycetota bacterium]
MTDDQAMNSFNPEVMPRTTQLIADAGTVFNEFVVSTPLCCPSRATYLTGQYAHNNGVVSNDPGYADLRDKDSTLPAWLGEAGYQTAHVGKFLHGYEETALDPATPAPGFDEWHGMLRPFSYYGFDLSSNGRRVTHDRESYLTSTLTNKAVRVVTRGAASAEPLFLSVAYWAPHGTRHSPGSSCDRAPAPAPGDRRLFEKEPLPRPASFDERDVSDKPSFVRELPRLSREQVKALRERYRCTLASLQAVDRGVERVYEAFDAAGEIDNTVFIFTSDNGYYFGEHRLSGKSLPYEEAIRVPLAIRLPAALQPEGRAVRKTSAMTANIDLAPTVLDLAGAEPCTPDDCRTMDGRSVLPLMLGDETWPANRAVLLESHRNELDGQSCRYRAIRTTQVLYAEHASVLDPRTGECRRASETERYDLAADPFELENLYPADSGSAERRYERELADRTAALATCAGVPGRDPEPTSGSYCE